MSDNILVKFLRDGQEFIGCVVATGPNQVGVSICRSGDRFSKQLGRNIAVGRARKGREILVPNREILDGPIVIEDDTLFIPERRNLRDLVETEISIMRERSMRYFKEESVKESVNA